MLADPEARGLDAAFRRWCWKKGIGVSGRIFLASRGAIKARLRRAGQALPGVTPACLPRASLRQLGSNMISPGRLWWLLRRDFRRGWTGSRHFYRTLPKIKDWRWPFPTEQPQAVPVHILTGKEDWQLAAWMLASWGTFSERSWQIVIHDDGTLPAEGRAAFEAMFPRLRIITRAEADEKMEALLKPFPFCYEYRCMHPLALKVFDVPHFTTGSRYLLLDSDVLFFNHPREILDWTDGKTEGCWFNADVADTALVSAKEAMDELSVKLWPNVNTGISLITRSAMDLDFCDRALAQTSILRGHIWRVEQTLYALCASRAEKGGLLSPAYEVSLGRHSAPDAVARHYVGAVRNRFFAEGLDRLHKVLLHDDG